jgi:hypothetical protein
MLLVSQSFFRASLGVGAMLSVACSSGGSSGSGGSSDTSGSQFACILDGACTLTTGLTSQTLGAVQADCADGKGTGASSCPTAGLIACCIFFSSGASTEVLCDYGDSGAPGDPTATKMCMQ